jgi:hypothetical protein
LGGSEEGTSVPAKKRKLEEDPAFALPDNKKRRPDIDVSISKNVLTHPLVIQVDFRIRWMISGTRNTN